MVKFILKKKKGKILQSLFILLDKKSVLLPACLDTLGEVPCLRHTHTSPRCLWA